VRSCREFSPRAGWTGPRRHRADLKRHSGAGDSPACGSPGLSGEEPTAIPRTPALPGQDQEPDRSRGAGEWSEEDLTEFEAVVERLILDLGLRMACSHANRNLTSSLFAPIMGFRRALRNSSWDDASP
jgi:hypothetical protein